jgi:hypothetical protein
VLLGEEPEATSQDTRPQPGSRALVDWFNTMDASQKGELREINEQNARRFEAKIEQRSAELHAKLDAKIDRVDTKIDRVAAELNAKIDKTAAELKEVLERRLGEQARWPQLTWAVQAAI